MKAWQHVNQIIAATESEMSIEDLVRIKEFIDSVIIIRTNYLSKEGK